MAYQALYRKWRPDDFDGIVGQEGVVKTLKNQLSSGRVGHAYLFSGTRGTGKTSAAKILSRAVNCPDCTALGGNPCNRCRSCLSIKNGSSMNVIEIDAASNNGVDNIRAIREEVEYPPVDMRYKVYIIDEVHMLSTGAFNALLKTLEEPPSYVIFILATTDPEKLPATIMSRCQRYDFRRIPSSLIADRLSLICESESIRTKKSALTYIAEAADGSLRDALSILDQCAACHPEGLEADNVRTLIGAADEQTYAALYKKILDGDPEGALITLGGMIDAGGDILRIAGDMIWYLRNVLLAGSIRPGAAELLDMSGERLSLAQADARLTDRKHLMRILREFAAFPGRARYASGKRVLLEMLILELCLEAPEGSKEPAATTRVPAPAAPPETSGRHRQPGVDTSRTKSENPVAQPASAAPEETMPHFGTRLEGESATDAIIRNWDELLKGLHPSNRPLFSGAMLTVENGRPVIVFRNNMNYRLASTNIEENGVLRLRKLAEELTGEKVNIAARIAKPGELERRADTITDEDLSKIRFRVDITD